MRTHKQANFNVNTSTNRQWEGCALPHHQLAELAPLTRFFSRTMYESTAELSMKVLKSMNKNIE